MGNRLHSRRRGVAVRSLALGMALCSLVSWRPAAGSPGEIFETAAPAVQDTPQQAASITPDSAGVSSQTGALTYSFPIKVPPGRVQPSLSLDYSSQAPIYSQLASGFSLGGLPIITEETSAGRLAASALSLPKTYASSMAGGRPLVPVTEQGEGVGQYWTCKNGQDEWACRDNIDTRTRTVSRLCALPSTTGPDYLTPLLWHETAVRLQSIESTPVSTQCSESSEVDFIGARRTTTTFALAADATTYRLRPTGTISEELGASGYEVYAKTATVWDASYRVATDEDVWFSNLDDPCVPDPGAPPDPEAPTNHCARTHRVYDMNTGNLLERAKPEQWAAGGTAKAVYAYDARKLFVATETLEPAGFPVQSQQFDFTYEYGTGTKLVTRGPNIAACALTTPPSCPAGTPDKEEHKIRVDGLGRTIERWETYSDDGSSYPSRLVEINTYDHDTLPASVTHKAALDINNQGVIVYSEDKTEFDGHGRAITNSRVGASAEGTREPDRG